MPSTASAALKAVAPLMVVALVRTSPPMATDVVAAKVSPASNTFIVAPTLSDRSKGSRDANQTGAPTADPGRQDQNLNSARFSGVTIFAGPRINSPPAPIVYSPSLPAVSFSPSLPVILHCASA